MRDILKVASLLATAAVCFIMTMFGFIWLSEGYNFLKPDIDTVYAPNFTQAKFDSIKPGLDSVQVISLLGQPLERQQLDNSQCLWYYTNDGKCTFGDYAWLGREVYINANGKVVQTVKNIHYD